MNKQPDIFEDTRKKIDEMLEHFKQGVVANSNTVKDGVNTPEEELQEPGNFIFIKTYETVKHVMSQPAIHKSFEKVSEVIGREASIEMALGIMSLTAHSSYQAMVVYDNLLRDELVKQLDMMVNQINDNNADIQALKKVIEVQQKTISLLKNDKDLNDIKKEFDSL